MFTLCTRNSAKKTESNMMLKEKKLLLQEGKEQDGNDISGYSSLPLSISVLLPSILCLWSLFQDQYTQC